MREPAREWTAPVRAEIHGREYGVTCFHDAEQFIHGLPAEEQHTLLGAFGEDAFF